VCVCALNIKWESTSHALAHVTKMNWICSVYMWHWYRLNLVSDQIFHIAFYVNILWGLRDLTAVPWRVLARSRDTLDFPRMFYGKCAWVWNIYIIPLNHLDTCVKADKQKQKDKFIWLHIIFFYKAFFLFLYLIKAPSFTVIEVLLRTKSNRFKTTSRFSSDNTL